MIDNNDLENNYLTSGQAEEVRGLHDRERKIVSIGLLLVITFGLVDFFEDISEGLEWIMVAADLIYVSIMLALLFYIWRNVPLARKRASALLEQQFDKQRADAEAWRIKSAKLLEGLGQMIDEQLTAWQLTGAEKEVAVLLLKGYSLRQIAIARGTGERTARQQAAEVYTKAQLSGRAELSAFFLEDLLPAARDSTGN